MIDLGKQPLTSCNGTANLRRPLVAAVASAFLLFPIFATARPVKFIIQPNSAELEYISVHKKMKGEKEYLSYVSSWYSARSGDTKELNGLYCVRVSWPDGRKFRGLLKVEPGESLLKETFKPSQSPPTGLCK